MPDAVLPNDAEVDAMTQQHRSMLFDLIFLKE